MLWECHSAVVTEAEGEAAGLGALLGGRRWEGTGMGSVIHKTRGEVIRGGQGWH